MSQEMDNSCENEEMDQQARYSFTLILSATELTDEIANAIYGLGLDDALVGEIDGHVYVDLDVEDTCYSDAIYNCIEKIEAALSGVTVIEVHPPGEDAIKMANAYLMCRGSKDIFKKLIS